MKGFYGRIYLGWRICSAQVSNYPVRNCWATAVLARTRRSATMETN